MASAKALFRCFRFLRPLPLPVFIYVWASALLPSIPTSNLAYCGVCVVGLPVQCGVQAYTDFNFILASTVSFQSFIVSSGSIAMDPSRVFGLKEWTISVTQWQAWAGLYQQPTSGKPDYFCPHSEPTRLLPPICSGGGRLQCGGRCCPVPAGHAGSLDQKLHPCTFFSRRLSAAGYLGDREDRL